MARLPHPLASGALTTTHAPVGSVWHHIFPDRFPDPLGFGFASSRFSDPRKKTANRFGVYYVGQTFEVAFLETIVRDRRNGNPGSLVLSANDLDDYVHVHVTVQVRLDLVDLLGGNTVALGVPTDQCARARTVLVSGPAWPSISAPTGSMASGTRLGSTATRTSPSTTEPCRRSPPDRAVNSEVAQSLPQSSRHTELR